MYLDVTYFGYGVGLVMAAWFMGMIVGTVFRALRSMWFFSLFFLLFVPSLQAAQFNCYTLSTAFISHVNTVAGPDDYLSINGVVVNNIVGNIIQALPCKGLVDISCSDNDVVVSIVTTERYAPKRIQEYMTLVSLFVGSIAAIAFVLAIESLSGSRGSV